MRVFVKLRWDTDCSVLETLVIPIAEAVAISKLQMEVLRRAKKHCGFCDCQLLHLREGSGDGALLDEEDLVCDVIANGGTIYATFSSTWPSPLLDEGYPIANAPCNTQKVPTLDHSSPDLGMAQSDVGISADCTQPVSSSAIAIRYQTIERMTKGLPVTQAEVSAGASTMELAALIADHEGVDFQPSSCEDLVKPACQKRLCDCTRCVCDVANQHLKMWGYDAALKIDPAAFAQESHAQRWVAELSLNETCSICLGALCGSASEGQIGGVVVGNHMCHHFFHAECLLDAFKSDGKIHQCPFCRGEWQYIKRDIDEPEEQESESEENRDGQILLVVASPDEQTKTVTASVGKGATVDELKIMASGLLGFDCSSLLARSRGTTHDDEAVVVLSAPAVYSLCEKGAHPWSMNVTCIKGDENCSMKLQSNDDILKLKDSLYRRWAIVPSRLQLSVPGNPDHALIDELKLGDIYKGVKVETKLDVTVSEQVFTHLDFFTVSQRLPAPSSLRMCGNSFLDGDLVCVNRRCSFQRPLATPVQQVLEPSHANRQSLFSSHESWQVAHIAQSEAGLSCMLSCLYVLAASSDDCKSTLLRSLWNVLPFPPLCLSLRLLLDGRTMQIGDAERAVISNGLFQLLQAMTPTHIVPSQLFEHARIMFSFLLAANTCSRAMPEFSNQTLICSITNSPLKGPVSYLSDSPQVIFDLPSAGEELHDICSVKDPCRDQYIVDQRLSRLAATYYPLTECLLLVAEELETCAPLCSDQFPSWTSLRASCGRGHHDNCLQLLSPLSLKSCRDPPRLTRTMSELIVVFTAHGKAGTAVLFSPNSGSEEHLDLDQAAKVLRDNGVRLEKTKDREADEGIMVCLDVSNSMCLRSAFEDDCTYEAEEWLSEDPPKQENAGIGMQNVQPGSLARQRLAREMFSSGDTVHGTGRGVVNSDVQNQAATRIQSVQRGRVERKKLADQRNAAQSSHLTPEVFRKTSSQVFSSMSSDASRRERAAVDDQTMDREDPSVDTDESLQAQISRFQHLPGIIHLLPMISSRDGPAQTKLAESVLTSLCKSGCASRRMPRDDARRLAKYMNLFVEALLSRTQQCDPPKEFCCPITQGLMADAVCASDGFTYERDAIEQWFRQSRASPMTGLRLSNTELVQNHAIRSQIHEWRCDNMEQPSQNGLARNITVVCWMPANCDKWKIECELSSDATSLSLKEHLSQISGIPLAKLRVYHRERLLPEVSLLTAHGVCDGSALEVYSRCPIRWNTNALANVHISYESPWFSFDKDFVVGLSEVVVSLKCRIWAAAPEWCQAVFDTSKMQLCLNDSEEISDGLHRVTVLDDTACVGDYSRDGSALDLKVQLRKRQLPSASKLRRVDVVKQLFNSFIDRSLAYDYSCAIGLITFGNEVTECCAMTPSYENFRDCIASVEPDGETCLFDAICRAGKKLESWKASEMGKGDRKSPAPKLRIVVLSDGKDTASSSDAFAAAAFLQSKNIVVDAVTIGDEANELLQSVAKATGGYFFHPTNLKDAIRLNELEVFLSSNERPECSRPRMATQIDFLPPEWQPGMATSRPGMATQNGNSNRKLLIDFGPQKYPKDSCKEDCAPPRKQPAQLGELVHGLQEAVVQNHGQTVGTFRDRRILSEMRQLFEKPHPAFDIFPSCSDISFWNATVAGPEGTPYADGVWQLYIKFPPNYPVEPPELRFLTPIKHCNVNQHGRVCHSIFGRNWTRDTCTISVLENVYGLLLSPDVEDPLDSSLALSFYDDSGLYESSIVDHVQKHAKDKTRSEWVSFLSAPEDQPTQE